MRIQYILPLFLGLLICFQASAITTPVSLAHHPAEDSTQVKLPVPAAMPSTAKKVGFFGKLKNKLFSLYLQRQLKANQGASAKSILGWVSLGMIMLSIVLLAVLSGGGGAVVGILFWGGLLAGLVSLIMPRSEADKAKGKKGNTGALIGLAVGVGFIVGLLVLISALSW